MDFTFDRDTPATTVAGRLAAPFRRLVSRLLRPIFDRLRELLRTMSSQQDADRARVAVLERQVAALQTKLDAARPLLTDYLAVTRRLALIEDRMLCEMTGLDPRQAAGRAA